MPRTAAAFTLILAGGVLAAPPAAAQTGEPYLRVLALPLSDARKPCPNRSRADGVRFEVDGDFAGAYDWLLAPADYGLLAIDANGNGIVDGAGELVGNRMGEGSAFDVLASRARATAPGATIIDRTHALFERLLLWSDADRNGRSERHEMRPVSEVVAQLDVTARDVFGPCVLVGNATGSREGSPAWRHPVYEVGLRVMPGIGGIVPLPARPGAKAAIFATWNPGDREAIVTVVNNAGVAMEAWAITYDRLFDNDRLSSGGVTTSNLPPLPGDRVRPDSGVIPPGGRREVRLRLQPGVMRLSVRLDMALFSDMSFEGKRSALDVVWETREQQAAGIAPWLPVFRAATQAGDRLRVVLREALDARVPTAPSETPPQSSSIAGQLERWLKDFDDASLSKMVGMMLERFELEYAHLLRHKKVAPPR